MRRFWPLWLSAALCAAVYAPGLGSPFLWDDHSQMYDFTAIIDRPTPLRSFFTREYYEYAGEESWRPMATMSYVALVRLFGPSPSALRGFHLLLHAANAGLLARLALALGFAPEAAAWAAGFFLIHAAHVETLKCVSFNEEILVSLGLLAMLLLHRRRRTLAAAAAFSFALLSKETGVMGLPLAFLMDRLEDGAPRRRWKDYAHYALPLAVYLAVHFGPMHGPTVGVDPFPLPWSRRLYFGLASLATAARVFAAPVGLRIEYFALPPGSFAEGLLWSATGLLVIAGWAWLAARAWKRDRALAFFLLWPAPFLALTSPLWPVTVFNTRLFAERWMYLPILGAAAALAFAIRRRPRLSAALLCLWAACARARVRDWSSETRLWTSLLDAYPWCAKAEEGLGEALFRRGDYAAALVAFRRARFLRDNGQDLVIEAYAPLSTSGFVRRQSPSLHRWLGHAELKLGDIKGADEEFTQAASLDPADGFTYRIMSYAWAGAGDFAKARAWLERGLARDPKEPFLLRLRPDLEKRRLTMRAEFD